ncbi:unnamed protein product, partial [Ectocarpus fasciculatus]
SPPGALSSPGHLSLFLSGARPFFHGFVFTTLGTWCGCIASLKRMFLELSFWGCTQHAPPGGVFVCYGRTGFPEKTAAAASAASCCCCCCGGSRQFLFLKEEALAVPYRVFLCKQMG